MNSREELKFAAFVLNMEDSSSFLDSMSKIIEFSLWKHENETMYIKELIDYIDSDEGFNLKFSTDEVLECAKSFNNAYEVSGYKDEEKIKLTEDRYKYLKTNVKEHDLSNTINRFYNNYLKLESKTKYSLKDVEKIIHNFLFDLSQESKVDFESIINEISKNISNANEKLSRGKLSPANLGVINQFLSWEDNIKDELVYQVYNTGASFYILNSRKDLSEIDFFKEMKLYLDTNLIFRMLGINGKELEEQTIEIFDKLSKTNAAFYISKISYGEFWNTVKERLQFMKNEANFVTENKLQYYIEDKINTSFYDYFVEWRAKGGQNKARHFLPYLENKLDKLVKKYNITVEKKYNKSLIDSKDVKSYAHDFSSFVNRRPHSAIKNDMENYSYMQNMIAECETKARVYFLTFDYRLINFCNQFKNIPKIIIHPARLYSLYLKTMGRSSSTDLQSFIKLIKIENNSMPISDETYYILNDLISYFEEDETNKIDPGIIRASISQIMTDHISRDLENSSYDDRRKKIKEIIEMEYKKENDSQRAKLQSTIRLNKLLLWIISIITLLFLSMLILVFYLFGVLTSPLDLVISSVMTILISASPHIYRYVNVNNKKKD